MLRQTLILDDLFDPAQGWPYPAHQVPVERSAAHDGNPYYQLRVDGVDVIVFEQTEWADRSRAAETPASRLCVLVPTTFTMTQATVLLASNGDTHGLPTWALDDDGDAVLTHALPFAEGFPVDWLRKQLLVSISVAVEAMREVASGLDQQERARPGRQWANAREAASVAGSFARAFFLF